MRRRARYQRFSALDLEEMWRLVASGQPFTDVAAELATTRNVVRLLVGKSGGLRPRLRHGSRWHLSPAEREEISRGLLSGESRRAIARRLRRAPSTITREVGRNAGPASYRAISAEQRALAQRCRPKVAKLVRQPQLRTIVEQLLRLHWSPQQIAARLRHEYPDQPAMQLSHETIYQSLFIQARGALRRELSSYLRRPRTQRRSPQRVDRRGRRSDMVNISQRPAEVADRAVPGHWEGDLVIGRRGSAIGTLVERRTRFVLLLALPAGHAAPAVRAALSARILSLPQQLRCSLTWDQGGEMAEHARFTIDTGVQVYFCDPHSPWQRGSNENTNGLLRQYFPRTVDLASVSQEQLDAVAAELNGRPRQTLGWMKPCEALAEVLR